MGMGMEGRSHFGLRQRDRDAEFWIESAIVVVPGCWYSTVGVCG